jgi:molecular chaperone IbpA
MNTLKLGSLYRRSVGFDHFADLLESLSTGQEDSSPNYPPYDIEKYDDERYGITMAVAGFSIDDLDIVQERNELTVKGSMPDSVNENTTFLYRGIARRAFVQRFRLADHVEVGSAAVENGLLCIQLKREIPEAAKPRAISIQGPKPSLVTSDTASSSVSSMAS